MKDHADAPSSPSSPRSPGRPCKPDALTPAQRAKGYRNRLNARGLTAVKCHLPPEAVAYLRALCDIHGITISEAVAMAVTAALRGETLPQG